jgi:mono/diheme cytochrome c family protein
MPSEEYYYFSDADLGAVIAYLKTLPPVDNVLPSNELRPLGRALVAFGEITPSADTIDHTAPRPTAPPPGVTAAYGAYLAETGGCRGCHGPGLSGGPLPGGPPDTPVPTNISPAGIGSWTEADFFRALRTGARPDGSRIDPFMPWGYTSQMTDDEIRAVWLYLQTVPPKPTGNR